MRYAVGSNLNERCSKKFGIPLYVIDRAARIVWFQSVSECVSHHVPKWVVIYVPSMRTVGLRPIRVSPPVGSQVDWQSIERCELAPISEAVVAESLIQITEGVHGFDGGAEFGGVEGSQTSKSFVRKDCSRWRAVILECPVYGCTCYAGEGRIVCESMDYGSGFQPCESQ